MFKSNDRALFVLWRKKVLTKHKKVLKYYRNDCLQYFLLFFMSLLAAPIVKKSHI